MLFIVLGAQHQSTYAQTSEEKKGDLTKSDLRQTRKNAAHRRRRIIYNKDQADIWDLTGKGLSREQYLGRRHDGFFLFHPSR